MNDPVVPPPRRSGSAKAVLLLVAVFLIGAIAGSGVTLLVTFKRLQANVRNAEFAAGPANRFIDRVGDDLGDHLKLSPDESKAVREELEVSRGRLREIRRDLARDVREVARDTVGRISNRLPEEKRDALRARARERLRPWGLAPEP